MVPVHQASIAADDFVGVISSRAPDLGHLARDDQALVDAEGGLAGRVGIAPIGEVEGARGGDGPLFQRAERANIDEPSCGTRLISVGPPSVCGMAWPRW